MEKIRQALRCADTACACHKPKGLVHCPAHEDREPSLSLTYTTTGKVLLKCFAGCSQGSVIMALKARGLWPSVKGEGNRASGLTMEEFARAKHLDPVFLTKNGVSQAFGKGGHYLIFSYRDHEGRKIEDAVRFRFSINEKPKSRKGGKPMLYGLWRLPDFREGGEMFLVEGESDTLTAWNYGLPAVGLPGKTLLGTLKPELFTGFHTVYVWREPDAPELPSRVAARLPGLSVKALVPPANVKDISEAHIKRFDVLELLSRLKAEAKTVPVSGSETKTKKKGKQPSQAEILIALASNGEFFHDHHRAGFITIFDGEVRPTFSVRSSEFRLWLRRAFFRRTGRAPNAQAINDALGVIEAHALFDGPTLPVFVRVAGHDGRVYLDLGDSSWRAVEVDAKGWRVTAAPPVKFVRKPGMLPMPPPLPGGSIENMRPFLNLPPGDAGEKIWRVIVSWLVMAFRPTGPYPVLSIHGPQGSAKSTAARLLKSLVDPNSSPLRAEAKDLRDLVIAAKNSWCIAFDNMTSLPQWLSDGLCRLATGGGFATRALYTDDEEALFEAMRPVILAGINPVAVSQDLVDRQVLVELQDFNTDDERREEEIIFREFEEARPRLLGALLDGVSMALRRLETLNITRLPRMADFTKWATAAEAAWGWPRGAFLADYAENRAAQAAASVEADLVASTLANFMRDRLSWQGSPTELLDVLTGLVPEEKRKLRIGKTYAWPQVAHVLTRRLRKAQVFLKQLGIKIDSYHSNGRTVRVDREEGGKSVRCVDSVQTQNSCGPNKDAFFCDSVLVLGDSVRPQNSCGPNPDAIFESPDAIACDSVLVIPAPNANLDASDALDAFSPSLTMKGFNVKSNNPIDDLPQGTEPNFLRCSQKPVSASYLINWNPERQRRMVARIKEKPAGSAVDVFSGEEFELSNEKGS